VTTEEHFNNLEMVEVDKLGLVLRIEPEANVSTLTTLRAGGFVQLLDTFGVDMGEAIEVTYRLRALEGETSKADLFVKLNLPYGATLASVSSVFHSALLAERELCELFGLKLSGHPNPKRLLTTEGLPPFLRKEIAIRTKEELWQSA
jgi:NADH:ubiquinone oxidoreductase subunit C